MAMIFANCSDHFRDFIALNEAWIQQYFSIEEADRRLAENPAIVVDEGGVIFTAVESRRVVGACALFQHGEHSFELARMAVDPDYQRMGIGRQLAEEAIGKAKELGAIRLTLLTNTILAPAVELYRSLGFLVVGRGQHPEYSRRNLVMEMTIDGRHWAR